MIRRAVLNVAVGSWYSRPGGGQERLFYSLEEREEGATRLFWRDEYPPGSPSQEESPYGFKVHAFQHARRLGFDQALWLDASCWLIRDLGELWDRIERDGYYLEPDGNMTGPWITDHALNLLGITRDEAMSIPLIEGKCWGLDFGDETACAFLDELERLLADGGFDGSLTNGAEVSTDPRCLGNRGDISCASPLAWSYGLALQPFKRVWFPSNGEPPRESVVLAQGL